jgi:hypothetical protein
MLLALSSFCASSPEEFSNLVTTGFGMKGSEVLKQETTHKADSPIAWNSNPTDLLFFVYL